VILAVRDLSVRLGGSHILQGVTFDVAGTGVTALLGRNGVGKTTTLRAILGEVPAAGAVDFDGAPVLGRPTHRLIQGGLAYVPEDRCVFAGLTVAENLRLAERVADPDYDTVYGLFPELRQRAGQRAGTLEPPLQAIGHRRQQSGDAVDIDLGPLGAVDGLGLGQRLVGLDARVAHHVRLRVAHARVEIKLPLGRLGAAGREARDLAG
jgi:ABC-type uncharacterized transport system ATPase subunit